MHTHTHTDFTDKKDLKDLTKNITFNNSSNIINGKSSSKINLSL